MYPVLSLLRRLAAHHIYVRPEMLIDPAGPARLRLQTPASALDFSRSAWTNPSETLTIQELVVRAGSPVEAALMLARKENRLAEVLQAENTVFTMILGPEDEVADGAEVVRRFRVAAVRGVYRATPRALVPVQAEGTETRKYGRKRRELIKL